MNCTTGLFHHETYVLFSDRDSALSNVFFHLRPRSPLAVAPDSAKCG